MPASTLVISLMANGMVIAWSMEVATMLSVPIVGRSFAPAAWRSLKITLSVGGSASVKMTWGCPASSSAYPRAVTRQVGLDGLIGGDRPAELREFLRDHRAERLGHFVLEKALAAWVYPRAFDRAIATPSCESEGDSRQT